MRVRGYSAHAAPHTMIYAPNSIIPSRYVLKPFCSTNMTSITASTSEADSNPWKSSAISTYIVTYVYIHAISMYMCNIRRITHTITLVYIYIYIWISYSSIHIFSTYSNLYLPSILVAPRKVIRTMQSETQSQ